MSSIILLLGAHRAGKSTVGKLLSRRLGLPLVHLNSAAQTYWEEIGYDEAASRQSWTQGWDGYHRYMQPFDAHAIERALSDLNDCILELDSRQSAFDDPDLLDRVRRAVQPHHDVVLLLPSPDLEEAMRRIEHRQEIFENGVPLHEHFVKHRSNHNLAKHVIYTKGKTPEENCEEIMARIDPSAPEIILIGPFKAGKSTQGKLLAERLNRPQVSLDELRWGYYVEVGWERAVQERIGEEEDFGGVYRYWKRFNLHGVERLLAEHRDCVIDFGAGHSVYEDEAELARARELLAPYPNVVLILPSPDLDESVAILRERTRPTLGGMDLNRFFTMHHLQLAKRIVYTEGKTPEETSAEIAPQGRPDARGEGAT